MAWSGGGLWTLFAKTTRHLQQLQLGVCRQHECRGPAREILWPDTAEGGRRCRVICRGECCCRLSNVFLAWGLTFVSAAVAAQFTGAASARGGRDAELQSKGKHGGNSFRLEPGNCHQLSNPHVMTAYSKWAANQGTAKKAPFWVFFEELKQN